MRSSERRCAVEGFGSVRRSPSRRMENDRIVVAAGMRRVAPVRRWPASRVLVVFAVWIAMLAGGMIGIEQYTKHVLGGRLFFFDLDRVKIWNHRFYEQHRDHFTGWPIPLEFFDADRPAPLYLFKPNLRMTIRGNRLEPAKPGDKVQWSSNSWGFRGPEFPIKKPPGTVRIVCLGASTTEGSQGDDETYPYYLYQDLTRMLPDQRIEVINAGHHAYEIDDLVALLETRVLPLDPDVVLFYEAANNIWWSEFATDRTCQFGSCWLRNRLAFKLYNRTAAFRLFVDRWWSKKDTRIPPPMAHTFDDTSPKPQAAHFEAGLRQIVRETRAHGAVIVLSSFVSLPHEGLAVSYAQNSGLFNELYRNRYPLTPGELERGFAYYNRIIANVAEEFGIPYVDVAATFPKAIRYFPYDLIHLTPEGNQLLATDFAQFLSRRVLPNVPVRHKPGKAQPGSMQQDRRAYASPQIIGPRQFFDRRY
jgi:lysophospholipase L1-like esterase